MRLRQGGDQVVREARPIDISDVPELLRLAEEVRKTRAPRLLRRDGEDVAVLVPVVPTRPRRTARLKTEADDDAFLSSLGSWKGIVDTEKLKKDIHESRRIAGRPPIRL